MTLVAELTNLNCTRKEVDIDLLRGLQLKILNRPDLADSADVFSAIGSETRLKVLFLLSEAGELCVCDLSDILGQSVSRVSHQLRKLKDIGFVKTRKESPTIYYSISNNSFANILVNFVRMGGLTD
ncbi:MAG: winged helix-turn-helix transcriptional regulator [Candidatus Marinimicrobia bacterium]|nr:winged helix-turn-helix transcriptional regulator [Candidatus Neomarinimicrobiota bacterium]